MDIVIEFPPFDYGTIESINDNIIIITKESFAPGILYGSEGDLVSIYNDDYLVCNSSIKSINLDERTIVLNKQLRNVKSGDTIKQYVV